ncbi:hypothetical protein EJ110_NYTH05758 [Nymphaea thermarum]|nr:hypothetical protein EJ110_NYTH05758 [Nymphaea thermarum]
MVHSAYDSFQILRDVPSRIDSVAAWNSKLFFARADGSLRVYSLPSDRLAEGGATLSRDEPPSYVLERTFPGFFRKGTSVSLLSLGSRNLLLSLSDAVAFHRLPSLEAAVSLSKTKGASSYDWDDRRGFLCVGRQRRVIIYRHEGYLFIITFTITIIIIMPLCGSDPILVLDFSMRVLERHPSETIELFLSGGVPPDLVNSYLKQHSPQMQATYLEHMLSMNEHGITANLQNELVQFYLSQLLDCYASLSAQKKWNEEEYSPTRQKLISALENTIGYNPENLLKRLPLDALYEERALLLGRMQQHHLALSLYVHKNF